MGGGAYFTNDEAYALRLARMRRYGVGIVAAVLTQADFLALEASNAILPDVHLSGAGFRVQPAAFAQFNAGSATPVGARHYYPPGALLPSGSRVP